MGGPELYILLALVARESGQRRTMRTLAEELGVSLSNVHRSLRRLQEARLANKAGPVLPAVEEFLIHGARYAIPARLGEVVPGVPTAWAARPLNELIARADNDLPPVWPSAGGIVRGRAVVPLHAAAPEVAPRFPEFYEWLALTDALRVGDLRSRNLASEIVREKLRDGARRRKVS